jgi:hypothetical protein
MTSLVEFLMRNRLDPADPFAMSPAPPETARGYSHDYPREMMPLDIARAMMPPGSRPQVPSAQSDDYWRLPSKWEVVASMMGPRIPGKLPTRLPTKPAPPSADDAYITAYHGSPSDFDEFVTPAFFADKAGVAQIYRREGGGQDNLNKLGGFTTPTGWYEAHGALDEAGQNKAKAIELLAQKIKGLSPETLAPHYQHHMQKRGLLGVLLGRPNKLDPSFERWAQDYAATNQAAVDYLKSGSPLGKVYEARLPRPTAHYHGNQKDDIAKALAEGHKVITWGSGRGHRQGDEIIALDKSVIEILRKYAAPPAIAAPALASILQDQQSQ